MRAISLPSMTVWRLLHQWRRSSGACPLPEGVHLLHVSRRGPAGPLQRGHLVGIARCKSELLLAAWPLPEVRHAGSLTPYVVDPSALTPHLKAYEAAWAAMLDAAGLDTCRFCGLDCGATCLLSRT